VSEETWYYVDSDQKQSGPVTADFIRSGLRAGIIVDTTLVWCEGMPEWLPVMNLADELGLS